MGYSARVGVIDSVIYDSQQSVDVQIGLFVLILYCNLQVKQSSLKNINLKNFTLHCVSKVVEQELSYRKQIARQLRTLCTSRAFRPNYPMTMKSRLRVTRGHWKRNHWIDRTQLTVTRVIWC